MNWGYKIVIIYGGFVVFVISMVTLCIKQDDIHLVSKEYYKEEIAYQEQINKLTNVQRLQSGVNFQYSHQTQEVVFSLPGTMQNIAGEMLFFRPSDARKDKRVSFQLDEQGKQIVPVSSLDKGLWKVKMQWTFNNTSYFTEQVLVIQ